jgi:hypothetical protein
MIYHYTSIRNLALILDSNKFRFSRLDKVDDILEIDGLPASLSTHVFVSCWTEEIEESIPLWNMYTPNMSGIRLAFENNPFIKNTLPSGSFKPGVNLSDGIISPFTLDELFTDRQMILPFFKGGGDNDKFYKKVIYRDDYREIYKDIIEVSSDETRTSFIQITF